MLKKPPQPKKLATKHRSPVKKPSLGIDTRAANIEAHEYDPKTGHLTVTFRGGRRYRYEGVSADTAKGMNEIGTSLGTYLHAHIIGKHKTTKI